MLYLEISILPVFPRYNITRNDTSGLSSSIQWRILQKIKWMESVGSTTRPHRHHISRTQLMAGAAQLPATLLILKNLHGEELFVMQGWRVGASWVLATVSYSLNWFGGAVIGILGKFSPDEYSLIANL